MMYVFIQTILTALLIAFNIENPYIAKLGLHPMAATITLGLLIIVVAFIQHRQQQVKLKGLVAAQQSVEVEKFVEIEKAPESLIPVNTFRTMEDLLAYLKVHVDNPERIDKIALEVKTYQQCYIWVKRMEERYGKAWRTEFQGADMPVDSQLYPQMRSLIMEIALHTIDFCRYRTNYINLTEKMKVNPSMILLNKNAREAGSEPYDTDPYKVNKEVRVLHALIEEDGIRLKHATLHGYYDENKQPES